MKDWAKKLEAMIDNPSAELTDDETQEMMADLTNLTADSYQVYHLSADELIELERIFQYKTETIH